MGCLKLTYQQRITVLNVVYTAENDTFPGKQAAKKEPSKLEVAYKDANSGGTGWCGPAGRLMGLGMTATALGFGIGIPG